MPVRYATLGNLHQCKACREGWIASQGEENHSSAVEAMHLVDDARKMLQKLEHRVAISGRVVILPANSVDDDICVVTPKGKQVVVPCLRQQVVTDGEPNLCMADFIKPKELGEADKLGIFVTSVDFDPNDAFADDAYGRLLAQTLCDRLAEAAACVLHQEVRREIWGFCPGEDLDIGDLLRERNQGIRPAVGYPSLPDQSLNFILSPLVGMDQIGVSLTENGAMNPPASVCGLIIAHPKATYFAVGKIDNTQLEDYAGRRGLPVGRMRQFLAANISGDTDCLSCERISSRQ